MKKVLIIAHRMPPHGGGGVYRTTAFARNLPKYGYEPYIITSSVKLPGPKDYSYYYEVKDELKLFRTGSETVPDKIVSPGEKKTNALPISFKIRLKDLIKKLLAFFLIPDIYTLWRFPAINLAKKVLKEQNIKFVYSTSGPITDHVIAAKLKKKFNLTWIADFRDLWTLDYQYAPATLMHNFFNKKIEKKILSQANFIITVTPGVKRYFSAAYPFVENKTEIVMNGFEERLFTGNNFSKTEELDKLVISFTGAFYAGFTPEILLKAVKFLIDEKIIIEKKIRINFVGNNDLQWLIRKYDLNRVVNLYGFIDLQECIRSFFKQSDVLLSISTQPNSPDYFIRSKLFTYIRTGKTILCIEPAGDGRNLIQNLPQGIIANPYDLDDIKNKVMKIYKLWREKKLPVVNNFTDIQQYSREKLTEKLAGIFDKILENKHSEILS